MSSPLTQERPGSANATEINGLAPCISRSGSYGKVFVSPAKNAAKPGDNYLPALLGPYLPQPRPPGRDHSEES